MNNIKVVEHEENHQFYKDEKIQVQIKSKYTSKSLTVYNLDVDYVHNMVYMMFKSLEASKGDIIKLVCRKPPQKNDIPPA